MSRYTPTGERYIYQYCDKFHVVYKSKTFGVFANLLEAINLRNNLVNDGLVIIKKRGRPFKNYETRYIARKDGSFVIKKNIDGKSEHFGTFHSLEDAMEERDFLESIDWDWNNIE